MTTPQDLLGSWVGAAGDRKGFLEERKPHSTYGYFSPHYRPGTSSSLSPLLVQSGRQARRGQGLAQGDALNYDAAELEFKSPGPSSSPALHLSS